MKIETIEKIFKFLEEKEGKGLPERLFESIKRLKFIKFINELENHPDGVQYRYDGHLFLSDSNITKLPNDLYVTGILNLYDCKRLTKLPDKLYVGATLSLENTNISEIPDNLYVVGNLLLIGTSIEEIPNNLYVGRSLVIYKTPLAEKYTDEEIFEIVASTGGKINGQIIRFF